MVRMGELELGATLMPEPPEVTPVDPRTRPASSPQTWAALTREAWGRGSKLCGARASTKAVAAGLREGQCGCPQ